MNTFPLPIVSKDGRHKALILDAAGKCMFQGRTMSLQEAADRASCLDGKKLFFFSKYSSKNVL